MHRHGALPELRERGAVAGGEVPEREVGEEVVVHPGGHERDAPMEVHVEVLRPDHEQDVDRVDLAQGLLERGEALVVPIEDLAAVVLKDRESDLRESGHLGVGGPLH